MSVITASLSGELADRENPAIGTFKTNLFNSLYNLEKYNLEKYAKVEVSQLNCAE